MTTELLTYEVEEQTKLVKTTGPDITELNPIPQFSLEDLDGAAQDLALDVRLYGSLPEDAQAGDVYTARDLLPADHQTAAEHDNDALEEAAETGEEVVINKSTTSCNDSSKECNLDHITRVATPGGDIETRRTHTY